MVKMNSQYNKIADQKQIFLFDTESIMPFRNRTASYTLGKKTRLHV
jgi:hypothetical protein